MVVSDGEWGEGSESRQIEEREAMASLPFGCQK